MRAMKLVKEAHGRKIYFISLHEEDPGLNGILGFNENIAREHFHICGATGVKTIYPFMIARDVMIACAAVCSHPLLSYQVVELLKV